MNPKEAGTIAAGLRRSFDRSFAEAPVTDVSAKDDFLAIRVGTDAYAVRLAQVSGVFADKTITSLPSSLPELAGLVGLRGAILPVYDLRVLLGYPKAAAPRWLVVTADVPVALAFDRFDGHLRVPREAIAHEQTLEIHRRHVREVVRTAAFARPVLDVSSVLERVGILARQRAPQKEQ